jgi:hypothetical protein
MLPLLLASAGALATFDDTSDILDSEFVPGPTATATATAPPLASDPWTAAPEGASTASVVTLVVLALVFACVVATLAVCLIRKLRRGKRRDDTGGDEPLLVSADEY